MTRWLVARELSLLFRSRATWLVACVAAVLAGHGFVLALDLFSAASQSALDNVLMRRELDPLAGIVRPTLGSLHVSAALLLPIVASRGLAIERERHTFGALALRARGTTPVILAKLFAALLLAIVLLVAPCALVAAFAVAHGHVYLPEVAVAFAGHALHACAIAAASVAAAAATRTVAQAVTLGVLISLSSWAIEASEGFAALAWMGSLDWASLGRRLAPFEQGVLSFGALGWLLTALLSASALALALGMIGGGVRAKVAAVAVLALAVPALRVCARAPLGVDCTEQHRMSLPEDVVQALHADRQTIQIDVWLDRDDGRRAQVESDALAKLRLARPDVVVTAPLDAQAGAGVTHGGMYGRIVIRVGGRERETRSTSRREVMVQLFEAMGKPFPAWTPSVYPGYPTVTEGAMRTWLVFFAYVLVPALHLLLGVVLTRTTWRNV